MRALAGFILQGRAPALLVIAPAVLLPLLQWLSAAALALVTLRRGPGEGAFLAGLATLILLGAALLGGVGPLLAVAPALSIWLPTLVGAMVLRLTASWAHALQALAGMALVGVVVFHLAVGDATAYWQQMLAPVTDELAAEVDDKAAFEESMAVTASMMTSAMVRSLLLVAVIALVLGRYWQALLFNPGGFRREFQQLRLPQHFAIAALVLVVAGMAMGSGPLRDAGLIMMTVFLLQLLAVLHAIAWHRGWQTRWLVPAYLLLPLLNMPAALVGLGDVFVDLRQRFIGSVDETD